MSPTGRVDATTPIRVQFDQPVVEDDRVGLPIERELFVISPRISGRYRFAAPDLLEFRPDAPFQSATRYRVSIRPEVVGPGRTLTGERRFRFHTPLFALIGSSWSERRGQAQVSLRFSHPVDPAEVAEAVLFETRDGLYVAADRVTRRPGRRVVLRLPFSLEQARERGVRLTVDGALQALTGGEPLSKTVVRAVPSPDGAMPLRIVEVTAEQRGVNAAIEIETSEPVDPELVQEKITLDPPVEGSQLVDTGHGVLILGGVEATRDYRVRIEAGLVGRDGGELFDPFEATVEASPLGPGVEFADQDRFVTVDGEGDIRVRTRGVRRARLVVKPVAEVNAVHLLDVLERGAPLPSPTLVGAPQTIDWVVEDPEGVTESVRQLSPAPGAHILKVSLQDADRPWIRVDRWVLARGLRLVVKRSAGRLWAFVASSDSGRPADGARVRIRSEGNQVLGEGRTGADGAVAIPLEAGVPALVSVDRGDDFALLSLRGSRLVVPPPDSQRGAGGLLVGDQSVMPGEGLRALAFVPQASLPATVDFRWAGSDGPVANAEAAVTRADVYGWAEARSTAPHRVDLDRLDLIAEESGRDELGRAAVRLDPAFHRGFDLRVEPAGSKANAPTFQVESQDATSIVARCRYAPRTISGPGASRARGAFDPFEGPKRAVEETSVACPIPDGVRGPAWVELEVEASDDLGRRAHRVVRAPFSRESEVVAFEARSGRDPVVRLAIVDDEGGSGQSRSLAYRWSQLVSTTSLVWQEGSGLIRQGASRERPVAQGRLTTTDGLTEVPFEAPGPGRYRLVVEANEVRGETTLVVAADDPLLQVDVTPERPEAGSKVRVRVRAERSGWALVSLEQDRVLSHRWVQVVGGRGDVELPVPAETGPRAHVVVAHAGRAAVEDLSIDAEPAPPAVAVRPYGRKDEQLRYLVQVDPPPAGPTSVVIATEANGALEAAWRAWQRRGALQVATYDLDPTSTVRVRSVATSSSASVVRRWHRAAVGRDGWAAFETPEPLPTGRLPYLLRDGDRLRVGLVEVEPHPDPWVALSGPGRAQVGDQVALSVQASDATDLAWTGADGPRIAASAPGPWTVGAASGDARSTWDVWVTPPAPQISVGQLWSGYERPGAARVPSGERGWTWIGPSPSWLGTGTLLALEARPPDAPTVVARLGLELSLGSAAAGTVREALGFDAFDATAAVREVARVANAPSDAVDPWTRLGALVALREADQAGMDVRRVDIAAAAEAIESVAGADGEGPAAVLRALSGTPPEPTGDAWADFLVQAVLDPGAADLERWLAEPQSHPAREALRLWATQRAHFAQSPRSYWGSLDLDGASIRRFNYQRTTSADLSAAGELVMSTTGSGRAFAGFAVEGAGDRPADARVELLAVGGGRVSTLRTGEAAWLIVVVDRREPWSMQVQLPAGLALESLSSDLPVEGGPPLLGGDRVRYDVERAQITASSDAGPGAIRAIVRGAWPGRYVGPHLVVASRDRLDQLGVVDAGPIQVTD